MDVRRGREATLEADREATEAVVDHAASERTQIARVWQPHRQVAFGRRDVRSEGYKLAREAAEQRGFPSTSREVGGRAVAFTGQTIAFVHAIPVEDGRETIEERYDDATALLQRALSDLGVDTRSGEPPNSFCPGSHSLQAEGKLTGLAQRVRVNVAVVAGVVLTSDHDVVADVLEPVYDSLGVAFDPTSVGSVAAAGGPDDPVAVADAIAETLKGKHSTVEE